MKKLKIINAVYGDATGGRWKAMLNISDTLESSGHEVVLVRGLENEHLDSGHRPINIISSRGFYSILGALKLRSFIIDQQPDLIIAHSGKAVWSFKNAMIGMSKKIPVIAINHSHNVKRTVRADAFINITPHVEFLVKSLQNDSDKKKKPHKVISNLLYLPAEPAEAKLFNQPLTIVMLTRMTENKGVHILIKSIHLLKEKGVYVKAILAGEGERKKDYEKLAIDLNVSDRITFPGWLNGQDKIDLYHRADIVAVPSLYDIQPLGILDAFSWGKVVISSDDVGPRQICNHKVNAWVAKAGDAEDLAYGIEYLLTHSEFALGLAQQAKKEAVEKYCFDQIAKEHNKFVHYVHMYYK